MRTWRQYTWLEGKQTDSISMSLLTSPSSWSKNFDKETDWKVVSEKQAAANDRQVKLSRGKFLGGCSGCNGTLCIRGVKQDYDDWELPGWSGEEVFAYINKVPKPNPLADSDASPRGITPPFHRQHRKSPCFLFLLFLFTTNPGMLGRNFPWQALVQGV